MDEDQNDRHPLLMGVVGSTAYGLAHEGSDVDRLGVFAYQTERILGLRQPKDSIVSTAPDITMHEARKYVSLVLSCNPTAMELLWLNEYELLTPQGVELIGIRESLLSAKRVRDAYLGYATSQFERLAKRGNESFSSDLRHRTEKHARHLMRLVEQGYRLYTTGELMIRLEDPERYREFGRMVAERGSKVAFPYMVQAEQRFNEAQTVLADRPDEERVEKWLIGLRKALMSKEW
jgi:predicted nucleotidyltransferase